MIEIKLSQGAKPGQGGMLPAKKNTKEIAKLRNVKPHIDIVSPLNNSEFDNFKELLIFLQKIRELSTGKPIGIKLTIGNISEFNTLIKKAVKLDIIPDYFQIDGAEGGSGAAPFEFTNSLGTPLYDAIIEVSGVLEK